MRKIIAHALLFIGAIVFSYPFIWLIAATLKPEADISGSLLQASYWSFDHYRSVFETLPVIRGFTNSLIVSSLITASVLLTGAITGYAWSVIRWRGRDTLFHLSLLTMMMPFQLTVIPMYVLVVWLGLTDHLAGLIIPGMMSALSILLFRQNFLTMPKDLIDAARLDGCSHMGVLFRVLLPNSTPVIVTVAILTFIGAWNDVLWPIIVIRNPEFMTFPQMVALFAVGGGSDSNLGAELASSALLALPVVLAYLFFQRQFISSMASSGLKS